ncbi:MAG TPA: DUF4365 domain-containing protein [Pirellulales bacterium]|nr:DUF4365 domain-containing protein [Pirellulales bacterium]
MTKRSDAQRIGSRGQRLVAHLVEDAGGWIARTMDEDYGIDLELELDTPEVIGQIVKVQIKAAQQVKLVKRGVQLKVPRALASYADTCRVPVLLVQADLARKEAWYLWVQHWLLEKRRTGFGIHSLPQTSTEYVPVTQTLAYGLYGELQDVARWSTETQLVLTLNDAIRTAAAVYKLEILNSLLDLLGKLDVISDTFPIDLVIDQAITLGMRLWATAEGNQAANAMFAVCRKLGTRFTVDQVRRMVAREEEESYSRTGVTGLGILYDEHSAHLKELELPKLFDGLRIPLIAYYCRLREAYPGKRIPQMLGTPNLFTLDGWALHPDSLDRLFDKWANRGDSAILDYLVPVADLPAE